MDILPLPDERPAGSQPPTAEEIAVCVVGAAVWAPSVHRVAAALHSQPIEHARLREFIRTQLGDGRYPQLVLRLGTVTQIAVSVRRPPASVLSASCRERLGASDG